MDIKIYENGLNYHLTEKPFSKKELFIPFTTIKKIEMITIPINVKCLKIITDKKEYQITKKELNNLEELYEKLNEVYLQYKEKK